MMKKVRSSLNLDLDLSLPRAGAPIGLFALGWPASKLATMSGVAGLAVSIGITSYNVLAPWLFFWLQQGRIWAA